MLTIAAIQKAKPGDKPRKLHDSQGLYVLLTPGNARYWRMDSRA